MFPHNFKDPATTAAANSKWRVESSASAGRRLCLIADRLAAGYHVSITAAKRSVLL